MSHVAPRSRANSTLDRVIGGEEGLVSTEAPDDIAAAYRQVMSAIATLGEKCREQGIDPMAMMAATLGISPPADGDAAPTRSSEVPGAQFDAVSYTFALIDALDCARADAVETMLAQSFVGFDGVRSTERSMVLATIRQRQSQVPAIASRTWTDVHLVDRGDTVVFIGKAQEIQGGNQSKGGYVLDGWYLLQWVRTDERWQVQLLTWQAATSEHAWWNEAFHKGRGFSREPNRLLVASITSMPPGVALDLAMGQGRNALYLAARGWEVFGIDSSYEGVRIAREQAAKRNLSLECVTADIDEWDFGENRYDLITMIYVGDHARWIEKVKTALRPSGMFVLEGWAKLAPTSPDGFSEGQLRSLFDGYQIVKDEIIVDVPDWAHDTGTLARFVARKPG